MLILRNVFIVGAARTEKSTLSKKLQQKGDYNHIPLDYFITSLKHNFKETKISSKVVIDKENSKKLALLLSRVIKIIDSKDEKFMIDSVHISPQDIIQYLDKDKCEIYYLGYLTISKKN